MADFSSFTHKWRALPNTSADANKVNKRNRQPISCQPCRARKLKCDRGHPCETCNKRGDEGSCHYGKSSGTITNSHPHASSSKHTSGRAQDRLRQLEDMVRQMIEPAAQDDSDQHNDARQPNDDNSKEGLLNREHHGTKYTGSTHWSAILDQIHDLKNMIAPTTSSDPNRDPSASPLTFSPGSVGEEVQIQYREMSLFGAHPPTTLSQILERHLPPRQNVDRLLSTYFTSQYIPMPYIHMGQFQRQYDNFWKDTTHTKTSPIWLSILFSILSMGDKIRLALKVEFETGMLGSFQPHTSSSISEGSKSQSPASDLASSVSSPSKTGKISEWTSLDYLSASIQLLVLGDYARPQPFLLEALCIHNQAKYSLSLDPNREAALVQSLLVRQAYSMSYHRDCSNFPPGQFTVFEAEMRRRCWASIKQIDLMICFQLGIPMNVAESTWDTKLPQNLLDTDFDEDTKTLPEARGSGEPTQMLYYVFKSQCMDVFAKILRHTLSLSPTTDMVNSPESKATVMYLDAEMRKISESLPVVMKVKPMSLSFSDPSWLIMLRTNLLFLVQKSLCVLHRKYMLQHTSKNGGDSTYSRKVVVDASSKIVNHFLDLHQEFQPGGQLSRDWWMLGAFTVGDFLLAVMLLCFAFWTEREKHLRRGSNDSRNDILKWLERDEEARSIFEILGRAKGVCEVYGKTSNESKRVAQVLGVVLDKFATSQSIPQPNGGAQGTGQPNLGNTRVFQPSTQHEHESAQERLDMTPLSIQDGGPSASSSLYTPNSAQAPRTTRSDTTGIEATWDMVEAIPYKRQAARLDPGITTTTPQPPIYHVPHLQNDTQYINGVQTPSTNNQSISQYGNGTGDTNTETMSTQYMASPSAYDPLFSLMDTTTDSMPMDWTSFDQFIGNFNFNSATTPAAQSMYNASGPFDTPLDPGLSNISATQASMGGMTSGPADNGTGQWPGPRTGSMRPW